MSMAKDVLDREFLALRGKLIEVAAGLDRVARADGDIESDPRVRHIRESLQILCDRPLAADTVERIQMAFSLPYDPNWRKAFQS